MRSLVDVQRKVERRHRRDRQRQMLRVRGEGLRHRLVLRASLRAAPSGSGAPGHRTEQEGGGRAPGWEAYRQADAPDAKPAAGNTLRRRWGWLFVSPLKHPFQEDKYQQQTAVRERVEQLRRERSCVMQSKRDR